MKNIILVICAFFAVSCLAMRDPFNSEQIMIIPNPLSKILIDDLSFLGAVIQKNKSLGFVADPSGNVYQIFQGQKLGPGKAEVVKISSDGILLQDINHYSLIK